MGNLGDTILISAYAPFSLPASTVAVAGYDPMPVQAFQEERKINLSPFSTCRFLLARDAR